MPTRNRVSDSTASQRDYDAVVIGSGPNGLAAAIRIAQAGKSVLVLERHHEPGGGTRTAELTLPGFRHDVCSTAHPMGLAAPFLKSLPLDRFGLEWSHPELPHAQTLDPKYFPAAGVGLFRSVEETADQFCAADARAYRDIFTPLVRDAPKLFGDLLGPPGIPSHPIAAARFGLRAMTSAAGFWKRNFREDPARALFAGNAAHAIVDLAKPFTSAIGMMLQVAGHSVGWPNAKGGSEAIWKAMVAFLESLGGEIRCGVEVGSLEDLPPAGAYLFDTRPAAMVDITSDRLPPGYKRRLLSYRHGPGVFKLDLALCEPIPWTSEVCRRAGTVQVAGGADEIFQSERAVARGRVPEHPFLLVSQPTLSDPSRAPEGKHTAWIYGHVPNGWEGDASEGILTQVERFAPGFRDTILGSHAMGCADFERYNPNYPGGDIACGASDFTQLLTRPVARWNPYATPNPGIFLCSAATPPGAGVHGMCGYHAAGHALKKL